VRILNHLLNPNAYIKNINPGLKKKTGLLQQFKYSIPRDRQDARKRASNQAKPCAEDGSTGTRRPENNQKKKTA
jgi:hypothetical protein